MCGLGGRRGALGVLLHRCWPAAQACSTGISKVWRAPGNRPTPGWGGVGPARPPEEGGEPQSAAGRAPQTPDCKPRSPAGPAPKPCHARTRPRPRPSAPPTQPTSGFSSTSSAMLATHVCRVCRRFGVKTRWLRGVLAVGGDAGRHATPWLCNREARVPAQGMASSVAATLRVPREPTLDGASRCHWRSERGAGKLRFRREFVPAEKVWNSSLCPPSFREVGPRPSPPLLGSPCLGRPVRC